MNDAVGGDDVFHFADDFGHDTIEDFRQGEDVIEFAGVTEVELTAVGSDAVLTTLGDDTVTIKGFTGILVFGVDVIFT